MIDTIAITGVDGLIGSPVTLHNAKVTQDKFRQSFRDLFRHVFMCLCMCKLENLFVNENECLFRYES